MGQNKNVLTTAKVDTNVSLAAVLIGGAPLAFAHLFFKELFSNQRFHQLFSRSQSLQKEKLTVATIL